MAIRRAGTRNEKICFCTAVVLGLIVGLSILFSSIHSLEYEELGLQWSATRQRVSEETFTSGVYVLGAGDYFLKFSKNQKGLYFMDMDFEGRHGGPLMSRTKDGVNVFLQVSFFYMIVPGKLHNIYQRYGMNYEQLILRESIEQLTAIATRFTANQFFTERTKIEDDMSIGLKQHFSATGFEIPNFQLRTINLPEKFDDAVKLTQVKKQEIKVAQQQQNSRRVQLETELLEAQQNLLVSRNIADGEAFSSLERAKASMERDLAITKQQVDGYKLHREANSLTNDELLHYIKIRTLQEHDSSRLTMNLDGFP